MYRSPYTQGYPPSFDTGYVYTYSSGDPRSAHVRQSFPSSSTSRIMPNDLPDLYYEYGLATPPSASSSEAICTPPLGSQASAFSWEPAATTAGPDNAPATARALTFQPSMSNSGMQLRSNPSGANFDPRFHQFSGLDQTPGRFIGQDDTEEPQVQKPELYSQELILTHSLLDVSTGFISPAATLLNPVTPMPPVAGSQTPLKLHQPRPSRRIPIVNLDQLACASETSSSQEETPKPENSIFCSIQSQRPDQLPVQLHPISGVYYPNQVDSKDVPIGANQDLRKSLSCLCGCMESYTF